jgi:dynein heavy chain 1
MEKALENIQDQLRSDPIVLTLDVLKNAKRFHATVSFIADTGLKESFDKVLKYNLLMKDFPLNDLLSSTDNLDKINESLINIFNHLNKKLKLSPYPIRRALPLVEAISKDLSDAIIKVLHNHHKLMYSSYTQFDLHTSTCIKIFATWDELLKEFTNVAREVTRKRAEKFIPIKINAWHTQSTSSSTAKRGAGGGGLQGRIEYLRNFRKHHQQLVSMVSPTKGVVGSSSSANADNSAMSSNIGGLLGGLDMEHEVRMAWEEVKNVDILDTSEEGTQIWITAETA